MSGTGRSRSNSSSKPRRLSNSNNSAPSPLTPKAPLPPISPPKQPPPQPVAVATPAKIGEAAGGGDSGHKEATQSSKGMQCPKFEIPPMSDFVVQSSATVAPAGVDAPQSSNPCAGKKLTRKGWYVAGGIGACCLLILLIIIIAAATGGSSSSGGGTAELFAHTTTVKISGVSTSQFGSSAQSAFKSVLVAKKIAASASDVSVTKVDSARRGACSVQFKVYTKSLVSSTKLAEQDSFYSKTGSSGFAALLNAEWKKSGVNCVATAVAVSSASKPDCVKDNTLGKCAPCLKGSQCIKGYYCCPYMKKCVASSSMSCTYPIANCRPMCYDSMDNKKCKCGNSLFPAKWGSASCSGASSGGSGGNEVGTGSTSERWLAIHNKYRCMHGAPALKWSTAVAASAQSWADRGKFEHAASYDIPPPAGPAGENLAMGQSTLEAATRAWYDEVQVCARSGASGLPGCQSGGSCSSKSDCPGSYCSGGKCATGHFTALIWAGAKELGCGIKGTLYVCRYKGDDVKNGNTPNMGGHYTTNVLKKTKTDAQCSGS